MSRNQVRIVGARPLHKSSDGYINPPTNKRFLAKLSDLSPYSKRTNGANQIRSRLNSSLQVRKSSQTTPESPNKSTLKLNSTSQSSHSHKYTELVNEEQLNFLKEEMDHYWNINNIPEYHRSVFRSKHFYKSIDKQAVIIANEISALENGNSSIQVLLKTIKGRENIIDSLKEINDKITACKNKVQIQLFKREFLAEMNRLRDLSLTVIEKVFEWRDSFRDIGLKFVMNDVEYFHKMRYDMTFLNETWVCDVIQVFDDDPFLMCFTQNHRRTRSQSEISEGSIYLPINYSMLSRIKQAMLALGISLEKPKVEQPSENAFPKAILNIASIIVEQKKDLFLTEKKQPKLEYEKEVGEYLLLSWIDSITNEKLTEVFWESKSEMISASIKLYASNILDRIIVTTLSSLLPEISLEAYTEIIDYEYIDLRDSIIHESMYEELQESVEELSKSLLADILTGQFLHNVEVDDIVQDCISHERDLNDRITHLIYKELVESMVNEEWAEILVENEIAESKLDRVREQLPYTVQREILKQEAPKFNLRVYEMLYFDILNRFVGEIWLGNIAKSAGSETKGEEEMSIEEMFPLRDPDIPIEDPSASKNKPVPLIKSVFHRH